MFPSIPEHYLKVENTVFSFKTLKILLNIQVGDSFLPYLISSHFMNFLLPSLSEFCQFDKKYALF